MSLSDVNAGPRVEEEWHQPLQHQRIPLLTPHLPLDPAGTRTPVIYAGERCEEGGRNAVNAASIHDWPRHARHPSLSPFIGCSKVRLLQMVCATLRHDTRQENPEGTGGVLIGA